ncbi:MAG: hypothetical protein U0Q18_04575 [Bryobacteraceae bacterium]
MLWARTDLAGTSDVALLDMAENEARIVLTLDIITTGGIQMVAARRR